MVIVEI